MIMPQILAIRLRGTCSIKQDIEDTLQMLGLKRRYSAALLEPDDVVMGMVRKVANFITWGEASPETLAALKQAGKLAKKAGHGYSFGLKPPAKGLKAIKLNWPKGDLGYRGDAINELVKRMI